MLRFPMCTAISLNSFEFAFLGELAFDFESASLGVLVL